MTNIFGVNTSDCSLAASPIGVVSDVYRCLDVLFDRSIYLI